MPKTLNGEKDTSVAESADGEENISMAESSDGEDISMTENSDGEDISMAESAEKEDIFVTTDRINLDDLYEKHLLKISISKNDVLTLILAFSLRYQVSDTGIVSMIEMLNIILGQDFINPSLYHFWKMFNWNKGKSVKTHFFL